MSGPYVWDEMDQAYRDAQGDLVPDAEVRAAVKKLSDDTAELMAALVLALLAGTMTRDAFLGEAAGTLKMAHTAVALIAHGGRLAWLGPAAERLPGVPPLPPAAASELAFILRGEYGYLQSFAAAINANAAGSEAQIVARAKLYGGALHITYEQAKTSAAHASGLDLELNVMSSREPCDECPALSALGWVTAGTLPPVGRRSCSYHCRCQILHKRSIAQQEEAA